MTTQESAEVRQVGRRSRWPGAFVVVVAIIAVVGVAVVARITTEDEAPVAADEAQIEITYGDDGTTFVGDSEVIEGTVTVRFSNETDGTAIMAIFGYETGSASLAEELEFLPEEGDWGVPIGAPARGYRDIEFEGDTDLVPGSHTWTLELEPGTYLFDVGAEDYRTTGLWRAAIIEIVPE